MKKILLITTAILLTLNSFSQVPSYVPTSGLMGWFPFTANTIDSSGNGDNGTIVGSSTFTSDRYGVSNHSFAFSNPGDIICTTNNVINPQNFAYSFWFNATTPGLLMGFDEGQCAHIFNWDRYATLLPAGTIEFRCVNGPSQFCTSTTSYLDGNWHNCVCQLSSMGMQLYVDGILSVQNSSATAAQNYNGYWRFGGLDAEPSAPSMIGKLDDIGIWNRALTQCEITQLYNSQIFTVTNNVSASICQGNTYTFPDATTSTTSTVHTSHFTPFSSCGDSSIVTTLTVNPTYTSNASASICQGSTFTFPDGSTSTTSTVHTSHLSTIHSCDSSIVTTLTVNPTYTNNVSVFICQGNTYTFPDATTSTTSTVHTSHLSTIHSCDSSIVTTLTVYPTYTNNVSVFICQGNTYTFPDATTSTTSTVHTSHLSTIHSCDSSIVTTLTVNPTYSNSSSASICQGDTYTFPDATTATTATVHTSHFSTVNSCDSSIVTTLTVNPTYTNNVSVFICQGNTYPFPDGTSSTTSTVHTSHLSTINSCDSSIVTTLTVYPTYTNNVSVFICQGNTYPFPDGTSSTTSTVHTSHLSTINSCDSSIVTTLTVNPTYTSNVSDSICSGDTYTFPDGTTATTATIHTSHFSTVESCDSSIVTTLTINCTVGINETINNNSFSIYPNPTSGQFTIGLPADNSTIIVTNLLGQPILKTQTTQKTANLQLDNNGVYIIYVTTKQGTTTRKLVVNR